MGLGAGAIFVALGFDRTGRDLAPLTGPLGWQDYATFLAIGGLGLAFLAVASVFLLRQPRA